MATPDRLYLDKNDSDVIEKIKSFGDVYNLKEAQNKEIFLLAMAVGETAGGEGYPIERKEGFILDKYLSMDDMALVNSLAVNKYKNVEIVADKEKVYDYAQQCAHLGLKLLLDEVTNAAHGSFEKRMLAKLDEMYEKFDL